MHRLYSSFPDGQSGIGLLLLRIALGATLVLQGSSHLIGLQELRFWSGVICLLAFTSGGLLFMGFLTPVGSSLAFLGGIGAAFSWLPAPSWNIFSGNPLSIDAIFMALAVAFLGPGAFSLDARVFGRRKIIIPRA